jgi:hypothetical protein
MKTIKWAAVAATALFVMMNAGAVPDSDLETAYRVIGSVLALAGLVAAVGMASDRAWGSLAVIGVGVLNLAGSFTAMFDHQDGAVAGIVVAGIGIALGALARGRSPQPAGV